jgi:hypothetical protein
VAPPVPKESRNWLNRVVGSYKKVDR